jgi:hypothetical protein
LVRLDVGPDPSSSAAGATGDAVCSGDAGDVLDARGRSEYRARIEDLRSELEEARSFNDLGRAAAISEELDGLTRELSAGFGLGGRARRANSDAERARLNVTRAIHAALKNVRQRHRALGQHLSTTVKTGLFCSYNPDPRVPIVWEA